MVAGWSLTRSLKTKEKCSWVIPKVVAVSCGSGRLRKPFIKMFESQFKRGLTELVAYESGRKESFDCNTWPREIYTYSPSQKGFNAISYRNALRML